MILVGIVIVALIYFIVRIAIGFSIQEEYWREYYKPGHGDSQRRSEIIKKLDKHNKWFF